MLIIRWSEKKLVFKISSSKDKFKIEKTAGGNTVINKDIILITSR